MSDNLLTTLSILLQSEVGTMDDSIVRLMILKVVAGLCNILTGRNIDRKGIRRQTVAVIEMIVTAEHHHQPAEAVKPVQNRLIQLQAER